MPQYSFPTYILQQHKAPPIRSLDPIIGKSDSCHRELCFECLLHCGSCIARDLVGSKGDQRASCRCCKLPNLQSELSGLDKKARQEFWPKLQLKSLEKADGRNCQSQDPTNQPQCSSMPAMHLVQVDCTRWYKCFAHLFYILYIQFELR